MITQTLLDWLASALAALWSLVPPMPVAVENAWDNTVIAIDHFSSAVASFGIILPFDIWSALLACFGALMGFWGAISVVRIGMNLTSHIGS